MEAREGQFERLEPRLHRLAKRLLRGGRPDDLLQTTALVNEAYLRMRTCDPEVLSDEARFVSYAAETMRSILVDSARSRLRGEGSMSGVRVPLQELAGRYETSVGSIIDLDEALERMEKQDPKLFQVAVLKLFTGLEMERISELLQRPLRTTEHHWMLARKWLNRILR